MSGPIVIKREDGEVAPYSRTKLLSPGLPAGSSTAGTARRRGPRRAGGDNHADGDRGRDERRLPACIALHGIPIARIRPSSMRAASVIDCGHSDKHVGRHIIPAECFGALREEPRKERMVEAHFVGRRTHCRRGRGTLEQKPRHGASVSGITFHRSRGGLQAVKCQTTGGLLGRSRQGVSTYAPRAGLDAASGCRKLDPWCPRPCWPATANVSPPLVCLPRHPSAKPPGAGFTNLSVRIKKAALL